MWVVNFLTFRHRRQNIVVPVNSFWLLTCALFPSHCLVAVPDGKCFKEYISCIEIHWKYILVHIPQPPSTSHPCAHGRKCFVAGSLGYMRQKYLNIYETSTLSLPLALFMVKYDTVQCSGRYYSSKCATIHAYLWYYSCLRVILFKLD